MTPPPTAAPPGRRAAWRLAGPPRATSATPDEVKQQANHAAVDIRHKTKAERAERVNVLRLQLSSTKSDGSRRTEAKRRSLMYYIKILDK